jgi:hypothetical protein
LRINFLLKFIISSASNRTDLLLACNKLVPHGRDEEDQGQCPILKELTGNRVLCGRSYRNKRMILTHPGRSEKAAWRR